MMKVNLSFTFRCVSVWSGSNVFSVVSFFVINSDCDDREAKCSSTSDFVLLYLSAVGHVCPRS